jgi:hypothetical protein
MNVYLRTALIAVFSATSCLAQTGTVIFYTSGGSAKSLVAGLYLPKSQQPFTGWLFDGPQRLARVRPGRFMDFHLKPGAHAFTVPWHPTRPGKKPLVINVQGGGHYCVRIYAKMTNYEVYGREYGQIEEIPCHQAKREAAHMKPIEVRWVDPAVRAELDPGKNFPDGSRPHH